MTVFLVLAGIALLVTGGDLLVRGAVRLAESLRVSPLVIGVTLVGFGTSVPELATSLIAARDGAPAIAIGNVVGSNICNILLILGAAAVLRPIVIDARMLRRDGAVLAATTLLCIAVLAAGLLVPATAAVFLLLLIVWTGATFVAGRTAMTAAGPSLGAAPLPRPAVPVLLTLGGIALVILGANMLVDGAVGIARGLGVSEAVIGVTVVALGTSLPELVTSVSAALRGQNDIAFGNILGSNVFNVLAILGVTSAFGPVPVNPEFLRVDIWVLVAATVALLAFSATGLRITRAEGLALLAGYAAYCTSLFIHI
ncbi:calcium/sodium antiporter [Tropicimonas sp. IMCC34043]|uniref:calcium/sodium antiporter n=1 Tax=Tropicimonas sp. IMCC34043 TaxID=2248760 RepID=UPI000E289F7A|nr:calcium/sodium antiporter [Tropicimonas sp. IMCC34043]